jgi:hypothetical protein
VKRFGVLVLITLCAAPAWARKDPDVQHDTEADGDHWRIRTPKGAIHVWRPPGYDEATAGIVVYVHGHDIHVDEAWREYHLARQFRRSKQNAVFIVPEAPADNDEAVRWASLQELLQVVRDKTRAPLPDGELVAFGHSGAFRTIASWLDNRRLYYIILLDALYGEQDKFRTWLEAAKGHEYHTLVVIASHTLDRASDFVSGFKGVVKRVGLPQDFSGFTRAQKLARILFVRSEIDHMELVTNGKIIPLLLRLTPLKLLGNAG